MEPGQVAGCAHHVDQPRADKSVQIGELIQERLDAMLESMVGAAQAPSTD